VADPLASASLGNRTAVVTGGSTHLGRAIAQALVSAGDLVYIASRDGHRCELVAREITSSFGPCRSGTLDVTSLESVEQFFNHVLEQTDRLDVVVANAGGRISDDAPAETRQRDVVELNLIGSLFTASTACQLMAERGGGAVVLISSVNGVVGSDPRLYDGLRDFTPSDAAYHSAKGGVIQLARSLAAKYGKAGIRVNAVSPGVIAETTVPRSLVDRIAERTPLNRAGTAQDVASAVQFLAGPDASWITGQNLVVDGGWSVW